MAKRVEWFRCTWIASVCLLSTCSLFALAGCDTKKPWDVVHPASGSVVYKGKPVGNADLSFYPTDTNVPDTVRPRAKTDQDGKFVVGTNAADDGAPAGKYKVTIIRNEVSVSKDTIVAKPNDLPVKYSNLQSTDIEVEIKSGSNQLPEIELKDK